MAKLFDKVLNFVGWEAEEEEEIIEDQDLVKDQVLHPQFSPLSSKKQQSKVVNIHSASQFKVVIMQPENFDDAQDICDHLKNKKPVVVNLEQVEKECAQRIIDFLSGSIYALDGTIQKVAAGIFVIAPNNVDVMGDFKDELRNKGASFPWAK
ncbi:cell division inhibitor SepF [Anaerobacterium chartisolvens]|uniref:Cell division protein SepF n=1 Tax=Anaerobacterium chartisolvens TaxID=1297424 RepID=A0A369B5N5_9FIRM|nr:cell division protein SepF [Anaerobacterium chartisolvens]RCX16820.1 cell division inhibitor SepF [Anaerobacterium chartisolvens]